MLNWRKKKSSQIKYSDSNRAYGTKQNYSRIIHINGNVKAKTKSNCVVTAKYGFLSFIPLFCIEQLQHFPNQFFIFISMLQQIPDASPVGRFTTIIPLCIILCISAIKSIIEDIIKHKADHKINYSRVEVLRNGILIQEKWSEIGVGDILRIKNNEMFPADLVLLSSSEFYGTCQIETTNLDNELNLKMRQCSQETSNCMELQDFINLNGVIECELPNKLIYHFLGNLIISNNYPIPLDNKQFLPRGAVLRNTKWIFGVVIYTGEETKLILNQTFHLKESAMDKTLKIQIKIVFSLVFLLSFVCAVCCTWWTKNNFRSHWYLQLNDVNAYTFCIQMISFFILFHYTIPVTLKVYIDSVRLIQTWFINNDIDMYDEESNTPAIVRSPNLNVELGQVRYIFSDKTGTLTNNVMKLKHCSIAGELYLEECGQKIINNLTSHSTKKYMLEFFKIMSVCHTVVPEKTKYTDEIIYNASSPDEQALVIGAKKFGFQFHTRCPKSVTISTLGVEERYEILNIIEFTSSRKRMSVIVRSPDSKIKLYCKGADTAIFKRLSKAGEKYKNQTMVHINNFARSGYRTLCFAYVEISESFYTTWSNEYLKASACLINRDIAKNKVAEKIERKLKLIGVTAIENKLQDNVPKTIQALIGAAIKLWIFTGDKIETAINIGYSTRLITHDNPIIIFDESKLIESQPFHQPTTKCTSYNIIQDLKQAILQQINEMDLTVRKMNCTLVINGLSLKYALSDELKMDFLKLCVNCKSVICFRISPLQKAQIVDLVTKYTNEVTLAIGDGANDVPMFHKATIGVGVLGMEGLQAFNSSDYSIGQFKQLPKLLFVHGACNYERISKMIYFFYYKSICFYALQLWFAMYSGWSSQALFDKWNICTYNVIFTAAPPLVIGIFSTTYSDNTRIKFPQLYSQIKNIFNYKMFSMWIIIAIIHSILLFWICLFIMKHEVIWTKGRVGDYSVFGNIIYTCTVVIVCLKAGLHVRAWSYVLHLTTWGSILSWILFIIIYDQCKQILLIFSMTMDLNEFIFRSPLFWTTLLFTVSVVVLGDLAVITIKRTMCNNYPIINQK